MARVEDFFIMDNAVTGITDEDYRNIQDVVDTVKGYRKSILEKLGADSITEAINYAMIYRLID